MNVHTAIVPDKRRKLKDGTYPVKLRLTHNRQRRYYSLSHERRKGINFNVTADEWERVKGDSPRGRYRDIKLLIPVLLQEVDSIIQKISPFGFEQFEEAFNKPEKAESLYNVFEQYISDLEKQGRASTAERYRCSLNSFIKFDKDADFDTVDKDWLDNYEAWFLEQAKDKKGLKKNSLTTVGINTRSLRIIFNIAKNKGITENYPFGKNAYSPPGGHNIKKALGLDEIQKIKEYKAEHKSPEDMARDLWMFSYFSNGMNIKDICSIKEKDIKGSLESIEFLREKTQRSRRTSAKKIEVIIIPETKAIIEKWCAFTKDPDNYIFPFFNKADTPKMKRDKTIQLIGTVNKYLKRIAGKLNLQQNITTYHARHSYASILKESGAPIEYISETLGHTSTQTTEAYLKSFSRVHREKWAEALRGNKQEE